MAHKAPYLRRRGNSFHFRIRIPKDLLGRFAAVELTCGLATADGKLASRRAMVCAMAALDVFERIRRTETLTQDDVAEVARAYLRQSLEADEGRRVREREPDPAFNDRAHGTWRAIEPTDDGSTAAFYALMARDWRDMLARGDLRMAASEAERFLNHNNVFLGQKCDNFELLVPAIARATIEACRVRGARAGGDYSAVPQDPLFASVATEERLGAPEEQPADDSLSDLLHAFQHLRRVPAPEPPMTISTLFERWLGECERPKKTEIEFKRAIRRFTEINGDMPVRKITKVHVRALRDALRRLPRVLDRSQRGVRLPELLKGQPSSEVISPGSINKHLGAISAVLQFGIKEGFLDTNPASGMKVTDGGPAKEKRLPFSPEDLQAIFDSPVFSQGQRSKGGCGEAAYWLPVLAVYTGARLGELGQMLVNDVRHADGIAHLDLNTEGEDKRLKNEGSKRRVPLHPRLIELGFNEYVASQPKEGRLFPELKEDTQKTLTGNWSKWFGRYLRETVGITDKRKVFHSFRHTFKDACRAAAIPTEQHNALTGHSDGTVASDYGGEFPLKVLSDAIKRITYPTLEGAAPRSWPSP